MTRPPEERLLTEANGAKTFVRFRDTEGNPLDGQLVTIVVDTALGEVSDIIVEEI